MARYIDADNLVESLRADYDREGEKADTYAVNGDVDLAVKYSHGQFCYLNAMERVKDAPTADVAPRAEVAREIFEELDKVYDECIDVNPFTNIGSLQVIKFEQMLAGLKKEYAEVQK